MLMASIDLTVVSYQTFASFSSLLYGYDLGVIVEAIARDSFTVKFKPTDNET